MLCSTISRLFVPNGTVWRNASRFGQVMTKTTNLSTTCQSCGRPSLLNQVKRFSSISQNVSRRLLSTLGKNSSQSTKKQLTLSQLIRQTTTEAGKATVKLGYVETENIPPHAVKWVARWLMTCAGMVFGAVVIGGVTRLTESGLSMVDWKLLGRKPPRTEEEWQAEFEKYKQFPEFQHNGKDMTLADFKFIFHMEYGHRMWGRAIGVVFLLPALFFWQRGWLSRTMKPRILIYGGLIGFQGLLGWYMVKSGLNVNPETDVPRVSQYRLAAHLSTAIVLYMLLLWGAFAHVIPPQSVAHIPKLPMIRGIAHGTKAVAFLTAVSGAFVAGLDAGLVYNSWPKFADKWIPTDLFAFSPTWTNIFENPTCVQFNHRMLGEITATSVATLWWVCRKAPLPPRARIAVNCLLGMTFIQVALGITTLLTMVETKYAASHQAGSLALLSFALWFTHELKRFPK